MTQAADRSPGSKSKPSNLSPQPIGTIKQSKKDKDYVTRPESELYLDSKDEAGDGFPDPIRETALPNGGAMGGGNAAAIRLVCVTKSRDSEGRVEVLPDVGNYPIGDGPGVNPGNGAGLVEALGEDGGAKGGDAVGHKAESGVLFAGEEAHQKLVRRGTMEPPLEVGGENLVDSVGVAEVQGVI
ncbi:hypothetical protein Salat_0810500 [Sesamum alatum]|uniref:Uncharacterized protein n=1 Tax=Sesamum alatum TaxID=300844 RepID=A0AAE1YVH2_9LAMI|nr:hypothetical protein Salat_0810500 [Sesamum alatum]